MMASPPSPRAPGRTRRPTKKRRLGPDDDEPLAYDDEVARALAGAGEDAGAPRVTRLSRDFLSQEELGRIGGRCAGRIGANRFVAGVARDARSRCQYRRPSGTGSAVALQEDGASSPTLQASA